MSNDSKSRAALIPGAGKIEQLDDAPGGGKRITIIDPEGFPVNLIYGPDQVARSKNTDREKLIYNFETEKSRIGKFQRFKEGPAPVHKVRHKFLCKCADVLIILYSLVIMDYA